MRNGDDQRQAHPSFHIPHRMHIFLERTIKWHIIILRSLLTANWRKTLFVTMLLNFLITVVEIVGGILSGSLSLLSDAIHNFSDGIAIIVSYVAIRLSKRPRTLKYTFGLKRAEILAAVINASTLIIISFFLIKEAVGRF